MLAFLPVIRGAIAARGVWGALLLASIWSFCLTGAYAAPFSPQSDHCGVPHCVWSPFTGKLAYEPVEPAELARQLQEGEPWWPSDLVRVQPSRAHPAPTLLLSWSWGRQRLGLYCSLVRYGRVTSLRFSVAHCLKSGGSKAVYPS